MGFSFGEIFGTILSALKRLLCIKSSSEAELDEPRQEPRYQFGLHEKLRVQLNVVSYYASFNTLNLMMNPKVINWGCVIFIINLFISCTEKVFADEERSNFGDQEWLKLLNLRYPVHSTIPSRDRAGDPLILSPLLEKGDIQSARDLSLVDNESLLEGIESYAGYITVNKKYNSNLWFWYFPSEQDAAETPLLIWLQGGPGASSLYGLFEEVGPFSVDSEGEYLIANPYSWHTKYSLLFIDNPVGTGFSFSDSENGYCRNQTQIGEQLYIFLEQFLRIYTELQTVPLYITGESYAGKHIPSLAYQIHKKNPKAALKINLQGLAIGNGFIDPITMTRYSDFVYQLGLVDDALKDEMRTYEDKGLAALKGGDLKTGYRYFSATLGAFIEAAEISSIYNFAYEQSSPLSGSFTLFIQKPDVRRALHVGNQTFSSFGKVYVHLVNDFMGSAKPWLEELAEHYKVMLYSGQNDIICAYPLSVQTYKSMQWNGTKEYMRAPRNPWYFGEVLAGYVKKSGKFQEVIVRNAGHMVPTDQPKRSLFLVSSFIQEFPLPRK